MNSQSKQQLDAMQGELAQHVNAMTRICAGMTLEEMQNATFTYKTLLEVMNRRDDDDVARQLFKPEFEAGDEAYYLNHLNCVEKVTVKYWYGHYSKDGEAKIIYAINGHAHSEALRNLFRTAEEAFANVK